MTVEILLFNQFCFPPCLKANTFARSEIRKKGHFWRLAIFFIFSGIAVTPSWGATIRGQARSEVPAQLQPPVRGAEVVLTDAADAERKVTLRADALGYFSTDFFSVGETVELRASHPAFETKELTLVLDGEDLFRSVEMRPRLDLPGPAFDIVVQIQGAVAQLPLEGVPVKIERYDSATGGSPTRVFEERTSASGAVQMLGATPGFYAFSFNAETDPQRRPRYEGYPQAPVGRVEISQDHFVNVFLKPELQDLRVRVTGFDWIEEEQGHPLINALVEIRGVDPENTSFTVLHPRSDFTVEFEGDAGGGSAGGTVPGGHVAERTGEVVFTGLPPIAYEVRVSNYGHVTHREFIFPDAQGDLPFSDTNPLVVELFPELHELRMKFEFEDYHPPEGTSYAFLARGLTGLGQPVLLRGVEGTETEGVERRLEIGLGLSGQLVASALQIPPGRYKVILNGLSTESVTLPPVDGSTASRSFVLRAEAEQIVEVSNTSPVDFNFGFGPPVFLTQVVIPVRVPLTTLKGRLVEADSLETTSRKPIYRPLANREVVFLEVENVRMMRDRPEFRTVTDADGFFSLQVLPGIYGILVPGLETHFGHSVTRRVVEADDEQIVNTTPLTVLWPMADAWPRQESSLNDLAEWDAFFNVRGLPVNSGRTEFLELRTHRKVFFPRVDGELAFNLPNQVVGIDPVTGGVLSFGLSYFDANPVTLTASGAAGAFDAPVQATPPSTPGGSRFMARWEQLPAGIDTLTINDTLAEYDFFEGNGFLIPDWPEPGKAPANVDEFYRPFGQPFRQRLVPAEEKSADFFEATPPSIFGFDAPLDLLGWNSSTEEYVFIASEIGYAHENSLFPGIIFQGSASSEITTKIYISRFDSGSGTLQFFSGEPGGEIRFEGPTPTPPESPPAVSFTLQVHAVAADDANREVEGVHLSRSGEVRTTPASWTGSSGSLFVSKAEGDNFIIENVSDLRVLSPGASPVLERIVRVNQGMEIALTVLDSGNPMANLQLEIRNPYGDLVRRAETDENGQVLVSALRFGDWFVVVEAPGYVPFRQLFRSADGMPGGDASTAIRHEATLNLELLPQPEIDRTGIPHNRWGKFLPGVKRSGSVDVLAGLRDYDFFKAADALTADWSMTVTPRTYQFSLPDFDAPDGSPQPPLEVSGIDKPVRAWLLDPRVYAMDGLEGDPEDFAVAPLTTEPREMRAFLAEVAGVPFAPNAFGQLRPQLRKRMFVTPAQEIVKDEATGNYIIRGKIQLWELPKGKFEPLLIVETERGAFDSWKVLYSGADAVKQLEGLALPSWLNGILDLLGIASGVRSTQESLKDYIPDGKFLPLPEFSATIELDAEDPDAEDPEGFINYSYSFAVQQTVGQQSQDSGILALGPGLIGVDVKGEALFEVVGRTASADFQITGSGEKSDILSRSFSPKIIKPAIVDVSIPSAVAQISTRASLGFDDSPLDFRLTNEVGAGLSVEFKAVLNNLARPVPYVGPIIALAGDTGVARFNLLTQADLGVSETFTWETRRPSAFKASSRPREERVERRHAFGGREGMENPALPGLPAIGLTIEAGFGAGLSFETLGSLEAKALLRMGGGGGLVEGMEIVVNTDGTWPLIKEISGNIKGTVTVGRNAGFLQPSYEWDFELLEFKHQFGTETVVEMVPMSVTFRPGGFPSALPGQAQPRGPIVLADSSPGASFGMLGAAGAEEYFYTRFDPTTGQVQLVRVRREGGSQVETVIASAGSMGAAAGLRLDDGRTVFVYSALAEDADPHDPLARARLLAVNQDANGTLSAPALIAELNGPPRRLRLSQAGALVALAAELEQATGPALLLGFLLDAGSWSQAMELVEVAGLGGWKLAGQGPAGAPEFLILWNDAEGALKARAWSDAGVGAISSVGTNLTPAFDAVGHDGFYELAAVSRDGDLRRYRGTSPFAAFSSAGVVTSDVPATELALSRQLSGVTDGYLAAWTAQTPSGAELFFMSYNDEGVPATAPVALTRNTGGTYMEPALFRKSASEAYLMARMSNRSRHSIRRFLLNTATHALPFEDSDGDGLPDLEELRIIDANPDDGIQTLADVTGSGDFDGDGFSDRTEILGGSDPLDASSTPELTSLPVQTVAGQGGIVIGAGSFPPGTSVQLQAVPNTGFLFKQWTGDFETTANPLVFTLNTPVSVMAIFQSEDDPGGVGELFTLSLFAGNGGSVSGAGQHLFGSIAQATAIPMEGFVFVRWTGDVDSRSNPLSVEILRDTTLTAEFQRLPVSIRRGANLGGSFRFVRGFGVVFLTDSPWVYHSKLGWIYVSERGEDEESGFWMFIPEMGWTWTRAGVFPYFWRYHDQTWVFLFEEFSAPPDRRFFYNFKDEVIEGPK